MFGIKKKQKRESNQLSLLNSKSIEAEEPNTNRQMANSGGLRKLTRSQKILAAGLIAVFALGALGAGIKLPGNQTSLLSKMAETIGLKEKSVNPPVFTTTNGNYQLSKEYVYAGSRMLAIEDYGIAPTPTPSPTP